MIPAAVVAVHVVVVHLVAPSDVEDPAVVADLLHAAVVAAQIVELGVPVLWYFLQ